MSVIDHLAPGRLERSCDPPGGTGATDGARDWMRLAPPDGALERMEAFFSGHAFDPHRHDTYGIGYTLAGVQSFDYRGARADSLPGQVIVLHPDEVHDGRAGSALGFRYRMAYVEPRLIRAAMGESAGALPFVPQAVTGDSRLVSAVRPILRDLSRPLDAMERDDALTAIADALAACALNARRLHRGRSCGRAVGRAQALLDADFRRTVGSEELETASGLDRFTLARHFRLQLGTSPYRYLTMRRLEQARRLIRAGTGLAEVAAAAGFSDQSHLTRQFTRAYGLPPGRWRRMIATA